MLDRLTDSLFVFDGEGGHPWIHRQLRGVSRRAGGEHKPARSEAPAAPTADAGPRREQKSGLSFKERREYEELLEGSTAWRRSRSELESLSRSRRRIREPDGWTRRYREMLAVLETQMARWQELAERAGD